RRRQMGKDPVGRGIEPLSAVPPRHAKGLSAIHLSILKTEHLSARLLSNLLPWPGEGTNTLGRSIRFGADVGSAAPGSTTRAQRRGKDFPFRGSQVLGYRCARNSDQACNLSQRRFGGTRVVAKMIRELEEIPLPLRQRSQRLPSLKGRVLHRPDPVRRLHIIEESAQGGKDLLGG